MSILPSFSWSQQHSRGNLCILTIVACIVQRIPVWWRWYCWVNPLAWTLNGLITSQLGDVVDVRIKDSAGGKGTSQTVSEYIQQDYGFSHGFLGSVASVQVVIIILFACVFALCLKFLNFQKRWHPYSYMKAWKLVWWQLQGNLVADLSLFHLLCDVFF